MRKEFSSSLRFQFLEPRAPKRNWRILLSMPTTSKPLLAKNLHASEPSKPAEPVMIATPTFHRLKKYSFLCFARSNKSEVILIFRRVHLRTIGQRIYL